MCAPVSRLGNEGWRLCFLQTYCYINVVGNWSSFRIGASGTCIMNSPTWERDEKPPTAGVTTHKPNVLARSSIPHKLVRIRSFFHFGKKFPIDCDLLRLWKSMAMGRGTIHPLTLWLSFWYSTALWVVPCFSCTVLVHTIVTAGYPSSRGDSWKWFVFGDPPPLSIFLGISHAYIPIHPTTTHRATGRPESEPSKVWMRYCLLAC